MDQDALDAAGEALTAEQAAERALAALGELGDLADFGRTKVLIMLLYDLTITNDHHN